MNVEINLVRDSPRPPDVLTRQPTAVSASNLTKRFGSVLAVDDVTFDVPIGSICGFIGPNGAGKTTIFAMLAALLAPTSGTASVIDHDIRRRPRDVHQVVGYLAEAAGLYDDLEVGQYLEFFAAAHGVSKRQWRGLVDGLLELVELRDLRHASVRALSRGMRQRLSIARTLVHDPAVLLLDEPAAGLDPQGRAELRTLVGELQQLEKTVLISSHLLNELEQLCTDIAILDQGRLAAFGKPREVQRLVESSRRVRVVFRGGLVNEYVVRDDAEQEALLHRLLVDEQRPVVEFKAVSNLEDLYLHVTEHDSSPQSGDDRR